MFPEERRGLKQLCYTQQDDQHLHLRSIMVYCNALGPKDCMFVCPMIEVVLVVDLFNLGENQVTFARDMLILHVGQIRSLQ